MMRFVAAGSMRLTRQREATSLSLRALSAAATPSGGNPRQPSPPGGLPRPNFSGSPNNAPRPSQPQPPQRAPSQPPAAGGASAGKVIFDISAQDFKQVVLDSPVPVILDCWAEWCGPCKQLTPVLEAAIRAQGGRVRLAKLDTDKHPQVAQQLGVKSLPTVMMVNEGKLVDQFVGFIGEAKVKEFVQRAATLSKGAAGPQGDAPDMATMQQMLFGVLDMLKAAAAPGQQTNGFSKEEMAEMVGALRTLASQKLDPLPPGTTKTAKRRAEEDAMELIRGVAHAGLIRCALLDGNKEAAAEIAKVVRNSFSKVVQENAEVKGALSLAALAADGNTSDSARIELENKLKANPNDSESRLALAKTLFAEGSHALAIDQALELLKRDKTYKEGAARLLLLDIFNALGGTSDLVKEARRRMSSILMN